MQLANRLLFSVPSCKALGYPPTAALFIDIANFYFFSLYLFIEW